MKSLWTDSVCMIFAHSPSVSELQCSAGAAYPRVAHARMHLNGVYV